MTSSTGWPPNCPAFSNGLEQLGEVDVTGVEPMAAVMPQAQRLRDDAVDADPLTAGGRRHDVLANAPVVEHGFFAVPKVIGVIAHPPHRLNRQAELVSTSMGVTSHRWTLDRVQGDGA